MTNRTIKNFEIKELIATGGMAAIYKAVQVSLDRIVAVKILHGHLAQDKNFITRFEREAKAAANLKHENIVNIIDYGKAEEVYFIAMEFVEGKSLKELISEIKFIPCDIALAIAQQIVYGLDHAHKKGVVHRDIKPANILIGYDGIVKIADFGLAQAQDLTSVTVTGSIVGTPAYMSPEQAGGKRVDSRTDIFSLGVVIYEMITGIKPFSGENYSSVIHEILTVTPPKPVEANPLISREINDIIEKMLEKELDKRYQDIAKVNEDITSYFKAKNIEISRKEIGGFISTPDEQFAEVVKERKAKHFEQGLYFLGLGGNRIDDAISEFSKVLHLDPDDDKAKKYLTDLRKKKAKQKVSPAKPEEPAEPVAKRNILPFMGIGLGLLALLVVIFGIFRKPTEEFSFVQITSKPGMAAVFLDGENTGRFTPTRLGSLEPGEYKIVLKKEGFQDFTEGFKVKGGDTIKLNAVLNELKSEVEYGAIRITSKPADAYVFLDDKKTGFKTPCTIEKVEKGMHRIKVVKKGYRPAEASRTISPNKTTTVSFTMQKIKEPAASERFSYLKINVDPWAKIYIDGKYRETTPIAKPIKVSSDTHTIKLSNPNFQTYEKKMKFKPGETKILDVKLRELDGYLKLTVKPWADVYIDGKFYETTPIAKPIKLSAGEHYIKLINPSFKPFEQKITIPAGKMLKKYVELLPK